MSAKRDDRFFFSWMCVCVREKSWKGYRHTKTCFCGGINVWCWVTKIEKDWHGQICTSVLYFYLLVHNFPLPPSLLPPSLSLSLPFFISRSFPPRSLLNFQGSVALDYSSVSIDLCSWTRPCIVPSPGPTIPHPSQVPTPAPSPRPEYPTAAVRLTHIDSFLTFTHSTRRSIIFHVDWFFSFLKRNKFCWLQKNLKQHLLFCSFSWARFSIFVYDFLWCFFSLPHLTGFESMAYCSGRGCTTGGNHFHSDRVSNLAFDIPKEEGAPSLTREGKAKVRTRNHYFYTSSVSWNDNLWLSLFHFIPHSKHSSPLPFTPCAHTNPLTLEWV